MRARFKLAFSIVLLTAGFAAHVVGAKEPVDPDFTQLESVKAFDTFMGTLAEMKQMILEDAADEREAAEGMRFLLRTIAMSQEVTGRATRSRRISHAWTIGAATSAATTPTPSTTTSSGTDASPTRSRATAAASITSPSPRWSVKRADAVARGGRTRHDAAAAHSDEALGRAGCREGGEARRALNAVRPPRLPQLACSAETRAMLGCSASRPSSAASSAWSANTSTPATFFASMLASPML